MIGKTLMKFAAALVLAMAVSGVQAVSLSLMTSTPVVMPGDRIELEVHMDFTGDPTVGGGFNILFDDSLVSYDPGSYTPVLGDPAFSRSPDPLAGGILEGAAFGDFAGIEGPALVATLTFTAEVAGLADFDLGPSTSPFVGGFFQASPPFDEQFPDYLATEVQIVPVPAAVWLFGSGLIGLVGITRRRRRV